MPFLEINLEAAGASAEIYRTILRSNWKCRAEEFRCPSLTADPLTHPHDAGVSGPIGSQIARRLSERGTLGEWASVSDFLSLSAVACRNLVCVNAPAPLRRAVAQKSLCPPAAFVAEVFPP
jgi:hypothetical protein